MIPIMIKLSDYPQLSFIAWNRRNDILVTEKEALSLYEANWRWIEEELLTESEIALIEELVKNVGSGILNVSGFCKFNRRKL